MTGRQAAIDLIRYSVERGDTLDQIKAGYLGASGADYYAHVGGYLDGKQYSGNHILIERLRGDPVQYIFKLDEIFSEIKQGQLTLL